MKWINNLRPYFPGSQSVKHGEPATLMASAVIYVVIILVVRLVAGSILGAIPLIGILFRMISSVVGLYGLAGILLSLYVYYFQ